MVTDSGVRHLEALGAMVMTKHIDDRIVSRRRSNALVQILRSDRFGYSQHARELSLQLRVSAVV